MKTKLRPMQWLWVLALAAMFALSGAVTWQASHGMIDSDSASDMILAHHLYETGQILSKDWYYSTDLRVFHTQLVYAPLFHLFDDWQTVRFVGCMLLQGIMVACYGYFAKRAHMGLKAFCIGGSLLLMPLSITYGSIVLYHCGYIPHLSVAFALVGLLLAALEDWERNGKGWLIFHLAMLCALSVLSGLNGYRQLAVTHAPMALVAVIWIYQARRGDEAREAVAALIAIGLAMAAGLAGLIGNIKLGQVYSFQDYSGIRLEMISPNGLMDTLRGLFMLFGYRQGLMLMTATGLITVAGAVVAMYCVLRSTRSVLDARTPHSPAVRFADQMLVCGVLVIGLIFCFTSQNTFAETYFIPVTVWFAPLLARAMTTCPDNGPMLPKLPAWATGRKLILYAFFGVCLLNGAVNMRSFSFPENFGQTYDPSGRTAANQTELLTPVCDWLSENGYEIGHATFWNSNLLTEMSDGQVKMIATDQGPMRTGLGYSDWLTLKSYRTAENPNPFWLLRQSQCAEYVPMAPENSIELVYEDAECAVYAITDYDAWRVLLAANAH